MNVAQALRFGLFVVFFIMAFVSAASGQEWAEDSGARHMYDLSKTRILTVVASDFNYEEAVGLSDRWKAWGASVAFAAPERMVIGEKTVLTATGFQHVRGATLTVDRLLSEVDPKTYDLVYVAGGEGIAKLLENNKTDLARLFDAMNGDGKVIAAICHGPLALAASDLIKGRKITAQGRNERMALQQAGAILIDEVAVTDGNVVTGQWPYFETFAITVAERLQYPHGDGPFARALAERSPVTKILDDLRSSLRLSPAQFGPDTLETILRAALKVPPLEAGISRAPFKFVVLSQRESKAAVGARVFAKVREHFLAQGASEQAIRTQMGVWFENPPVILLAVLDVSSLDSLGASEREIAIQNQIVHYGAARENMMISARAMGLGVAMLGFPRFLAARDEIKQALGIPEHVLLLDILGIGHPEGSMMPAMARPVSDILMHDRWVSQ